MREFILMSLAVIIMARLWDWSRRKWELTKLEKWDTIWHVVSWLYQLAFIAYVFIKNGLYWLDAVKLAPAGLAFLWIALDIIWSLSNGFKWYYVGNGSGAVLERLFNRWANRWRVDRLRLTWFVKVVFMLLASGWFLII